jgi:GNAT superfamily N-acetyltransferase
MAVAGYVIAILVVVAVVLLLVMFAFSRRSGRPAAAAPDQPDQPDQPAESIQLPLPVTSPPPPLAALLPAPLTSSDPPPPRGRRRDTVPPIRIAEPGDLIRLGEIEAQSDPGLDGSGLGALPGAALRDGSTAAAVLLVAGRPAVAYIRIDEVDGVAHVDQLVVLPALARRGIGKALLDAAVEWAARSGYPAMTLSTFAESDWNQRVYDASGFRPTEVLTPGLRELRDWERAIGMDAIGARVILRRDLAA